MGSKIKHELDTIRRLRGDVSDSLKQIDYLMGSIEDALEPVTGIIHNFFVTVNGYHQAVVDLVEVDVEDENLVAEYLIFVSRHEEPTSVSVVLPINCLPVDGMDNMVIIEKATVKAICYCLGIYDITALDTFDDLCELFESSKQSVVQMIRDREMLH